MINIRGTIYLVDAYNPQAVMTQDLNGSLGYAKTLEYSEVWDIHIVPSELAISYRCPPSRAGGR
ncbi:MAG: hypothetical protein RL701_3415 [Pseudomonadota bacterium]